MKWRQESKAVSRQALTLACRWLQECTTGIVKSRVIFASMNVPSPGISVMQKTTNKVGETTLTLADLAKKHEDVKQINWLRGLPEDAPINIAIDSRYKTTSITGAYHRTECQSGNHCCCGEVDSAE